MAAKKTKKRTKSKRTQETKPMPAVEWAKNFKIKLDAKDPYGRLNRLNKHLEMLKDAEITGVGKPSDKELQETRRRLRKQRAEIAEEYKKSRTKTETPVPSSFKWPAVAPNSTQLSPIPQRVQLSDRGRLIAWFRDLWPDGDWPEWAIEMLKKLPFQEGYLAPCLLSMHCHTGGEDQESLSTYGQYINPQGETGTNYSTGEHPLCGGWFTDLFFTRGELLMQSTANDESQACLVAANAIFELPAFQHAAEVEVTLPYTVYLNLFNPSNGSCLVSEGLWHPRPDGWPSEDGITFRGNGDFYADPNAGYTLGVIGPRGSSGQVTHRGLVNRRFKLNEGVVHAHITVILYTLFVGSEFDGEVEAWIDWAWDCSNALQYRAFPSSS